MMREIMQNNHGAPYGSRTRLFRLKISREPQQYQYVVQSHSAEATQVIPMGYKASAKHEIFQVADHQQLKEQCADLRTYAADRRSVPEREVTARIHTRASGESARGLIEGGWKGSFRMKRPP